MPSTIIPLSIIDSLLIFSIACFIDNVFGEPPNRLHPTVWMGTVIAYLELKIRNRICIVS